MRKLLVVSIALLAVAATAGAELQNLLVDGQLVIRGNYYTNYGTDNGVRQIRWPTGFLPFRPFGAIGRPTPALGAAPLGITSVYGWDDQGEDIDFIEMRTRVGFQADMTDDVSAYIEFDSYDIWGSDFRSAYVTGADFAGASVDDVEVYQAYVEARQMWDYPLTLRIGRQEMRFGSEWLVGNNSTSAGATGLPFDGVRATYATDMFSVDAFATQLFEGGPVEADEDIWFYGVYGSYVGLENMTIDAYWLWLRDAISLNDTNVIWWWEILEDFFGVDDYDPTNMHTIGLRGAGTIGAFDYEAEIAYQFGDANSVGFLFPAFPNPYGDDDADFGNIGANVELGYTFDMNWQPRVYLGGAFLEGEDNRDLSFFEWLVATNWVFYRPDASVSFNRLFSDTVYSEFLDNGLLGKGHLSNVWLLRGGVSAQPTESVELLLSLAYFETDEPFDTPVFVRLGRWRVPVAPALSFWTQSNDEELGWELGLTATYHYTEDLTFKAGWHHFFVGDGLSDGNFSALNGLDFNGGVGDDDADYLFVETALKF